MQRCHRKNKIFRKIGLIASTSENDVLSSLIISSASLIFEKHACAKVQKRNFISSASCGKFIDLFSKLRSNKKALRIFYTIGPLTEVNMVLFKRNKGFKCYAFFDWLQLRWWRLPIQERACRKTHLGGVDYSLRSSALTPWGSIPLLQGTVETIDNRGSGNTIHTEGVGTLYILWEGIGIKYIIEGESCEKIHNKGR